MPIKFLDCQAIVREILSEKVKDIQTMNGLENQKHEVDKFQEAQRLCLE